MATKTLAVSDFPLLTAEPKVVKSLEKYLEILAPHTTEIPNPKAKDAKYYLNHVVEDAICHGGTYAELDTWAYHRQLNFSYANHVAGKVALAKKIQKRGSVVVYHRTVEAGPTRNFDLFFSICDELKTLYDALTVLKVNKIERKAKTDEELDPYYVKPIPTTESAMLVFGVLKKMTDPLTRAFAEQLHSSYVAAVEHEVANPIKRDNPLWTRKQHGQHMNKVGANFDSFNSTYGALVPTYKSILEKIADAEADYVQRVYLFKNVSKLANIIERKGITNVEGTPTILSAHVSSGGHGFSGEVLFRFQDGSTFTIRNKVVYKCSFHGKDFSQYPTTFHNVTLAGGLRFGKPSEERMIENWSLGLA